MYFNLINLIPYNKCMLIFTLSISTITSCFFPVYAVDTETWNKADSLLKKKDYQTAYRLSETIIQNSPNDTFGWWLKMQSASQLAQNKGKWPMECVNAARHLVTLEPTKEASHIISAIWCLSHENNYKEIVSLSDKVIPAARAPIGDGNYALLVNLLSTSYLKLGDLKTARKILKQGVADLIEQPSVSQTGYNMAELFQDESMTRSEREEWQELFTNIMSKSNEKNQLISSIAWNTLLLTDMYVQENKYNDAYQAISLLYPDHDKKILAHWNFLRDQLYIRYLGLKKKTNRIKKEPKKLLNMVFLVIPRTRFAKELPPSLSKYGSLNADLDEKDLKTLLTSFEYFRDSFEDLTDGIRWEMKLIRIESEIQTTNFTDQKFRYVMQPEINSIVPNLSEDITKQIIASDAVVVVWPGTKQPNGVLITNGGGTEWNYGTDRDPQIRLTILSDSNKNKNGGNHANHPIFLYHEMFHVLEWAYHKLKFPKNDHPYMRRNEWPKDYEGSTEWDFYSETFNKRMMKHDRFERLYWKGRTEGFYGIQEKEKSK